MTTKLLAIGFSNYVPKDDVVVIMGPDSKAQSIQHLLIDAKVDYRVVDCTHGRGRRSIILTKSGFVYFSHKTPKSFKGQFLELLFLGFDTYIPEAEVALIGNAESKAKSITSIISNARDGNKLVDCTRGRRRRSFVLSKSGFVFFSHKTPEALQKRFEKDDEDNDV